jgi:hypothetical protein
MTEDSKAPGSRKSVLVRRCDNVDTGVEAAIIMPARGNNYLGMLPHMGLQSSARRCMEVEAGLLELWWVFAGVAKVNS